MMTTLNLYWLSPGSVPFAYAGTNDAWVLESQSEGERILNHVLRHPHERELAVDVIESGQPSHLVLKRPERRSSGVCVIPLFQLEGQKRPGLMKPEQEQRDLHLWFEGQLHMLIQGIMSQCGEAPVQVVVRSLDSMPTALYAQIGILYGYGIGLEHNFDWPGLDREVIYDSSQDSPPLPPPTKLSPAPIELEF